MMFDKLTVCYFESKICKMIAINTMQRDSSMRKCFIMNKCKYEAFLKVYMMLQGVLDVNIIFCKYSGKRVTKEWLYWCKFMV